MCKNVSVLNVHQLHYLLSTSFFTNSNVIVIFKKLKFFLRQLNIYRKVNKKELKLFKTTAKTQFVLFLLKTLQIFLFQWYKMHYGNVYEHAMKTERQNKMMQEAVKKQENIAKL